MAIDRDAALKRAEKCLRQGKLDGAIEEYVRLVEDQPRDWSSINALGDLYARAGKADRAVEQFHRIADFLFQEGFFPKAQAVYKKALKVHSTHEHTLLQLTEVAVRQGLLVDARQYLKLLAEQRRFRGDTRGVAEIVVRVGMLEDADVNARLAAVAAAEQIGNRELAGKLLTDPDLLLAMAASELEAGKDQDALLRIMRVITQAPERGDEVLRMAAKLAAADQPERAYACIDIVVDGALLEGDLTRAANLLNEFVQQTPHIPALAKLVEICVDAKLSWLMRETQGRLAEAYRQAGMEAEAQAILDDLDLGLVAAERPEEVVGEDFFTDLSAPVPEALIRDAVASEKPAPTPESEPDKAAAPAHEDRADEAIVIEAMEIDLSEALSGLEAAPVLPTPAPPPDIGEVFEDLRSRATRDQLSADAAAQFDAALQQLREGREAEALGLLQSAARVPAFRFRAGAQLAGVLLRRGDLVQGIEWLERAAEAPAPSPDEGGALLYQLSAALEQAGESSRALAILLELDADMPSYRDVRERIDRLTRVQAESQAP